MLASTNIKKLTNEFLFPIVGYVDAKKSTTGVMRNQVVITLV
jgi:hypothetical protein